MAVSAVTALVGEVLDEEQFVGQPLELQRLRMGGPAGFEPQLAAAVQQHLWAALHVAPGVVGVLHSD